MERDGADLLPQRWAELRFAVISGLLKSPPSKRQLGKRIEELAKRLWLHPETGEWVQFGRSTIERWYYMAKDASEPLKALMRQVRKDKAKPRAMSGLLLVELKHQYDRHRSWSYQLHADNLEALLEEKPELGPKVSYSTVRRTMLCFGLFPMRAPRNPTPGQRAAAERLAAREVRSYEHSHVNVLWHLDFHEGSLRVIDARGEWHTPVLLAILDDYSRLCCHLQWYLAEDTENLVHGLCQAILKRGLPRALMDDNGAPMRADETRWGLKSLGIGEEHTLPYSPYQNGKQESFWNQIEGRLLAMLEGVEELTLDLLNRATLAWAELEYNRTKHDELDCPPLHP